MAFRNALTEEETCRSISPFSGNTLERLERFWCGGVGAFLHLPCQGPPSDAVWQESRVVVKPIAVSTHRRFEFHQRRQLFIRAQRNAFRRHNERSQSIIPPTNFMPPFPYKKLRNESSRQVERQCAAEFLRETRQKRKPPIKRKGACFDTLVGRSVEKSESRVSR